MCLYPLGGGSSMLIPPTEKARKLALYMRIALCLHFLLVIGMFISGRFVDAIFDLIGLLIGILSVRSNEGYSYQQVLCYCMFCGLDFFWACIREIIFFASGTTTDNISVADWQYYLGVVVLVAAPFLYVLACVISWFLYSELKNILAELAGAFDDGGQDYGAGRAGMGGFGGFGGYERYQQPPATVTTSNTTAAAANNTAAAATNTSGFRAFTGQGHRLG